MLIGAPLIVSAVANGQQLASIESTFQTSTQRPAASSLIRRQGLSSAEDLRLTGFLRTAAYGENAPGAIRISANLISAVTAVSKDHSGNSGKTKSKPDEEDQCFFQLPERFSLFKATPETDLCKDKGTILLADTDTQILYLCKSGKTVRDFDFAMGWNGVKKRKEGDERTPLGIYDILAPKKSNSGFHKYIHIVFPTEFQKRQGYTGSNVGIHGPSRWAKCLGALNTYILDWTNGCIAVGSDREIDEISRFVEENKVEKLAVYPLEETGNSLEK